MPYNLNIFGIPHTIKLDWFFKYELPVLLEFVGRVNYFIYLSYLNDIS